MVHLAIWLGAVGIADLIRWTSRPHWARLVVASAIGSGTMAAVVWASGFTFDEGLEYVIPASAALMIWLVTSAVATPTSSTADPPLTPAERRRVLLPLAVMLVCVLGLLAASGHAPAVNGHLEPWYQRLDIPALHHRSDVVQFMLGAGVLLFLQNSANIVVRLVLTGAGSRPEASEPTLKGGRLLGAMERTFIFALGVGGSLTAAAIIVAAKGLLRFPEISRTGADGTRPGVDALTEYFLVGSLASWLLALAFVPLFGGY